MSPSTRHTIVFLPSKLTGGLNSDPFWVDEAVCSALYKETVSLFEGVTASLEPSAPPSLDHPLPPFNDDYLSSPSTSSGLGAECFDYATFTFAPSAMSFGVRPDEMYITSSHRYRPQSLTTLHLHHIALAMCTKMLTTKSSRAGTKLLPQCKRWESMKLLRAHRPHTTIPSIQLPRRSLVPTFPLIQPILRPRGTTSLLSIIATTTKLRLPRRKRASLPPLLAHPLPPTTIAPNWMARAILVTLPPLTRTIIVPLGKRFPGRNARSAPGPSLPAPPPPPPFNLPPLNQRRAWLLLAPADDRILTRVQFLPATSSVEMVRGSSIRRMTSNARWPGATTFRGTVVFQI